MKHYSIILLFLIFLTSCVGTNNLYVNNPFPHGKGNMSGYVGVGTGFSAKIDSVSVDTISNKIFFSEKAGTDPILAAGLQKGLGEKTDLRVAVHLPKILGGIGLRVGIQQSFFDSNSKFNIALGMDLGASWAIDDSIKILGVKKPIFISSAYAADFFIPMSYKFNEDLMLTLTPRYGFNTFHVRKNLFENKKVAWHPRYPVITLGLHYKRLYFETSSIMYNEKILQHFGLVYLFKNIDP